MTASGFRYVSFLPLHKDHLPMVSDWLIASQSEHPKQNSSVCFEAFQDQKESFLEGSFEIEGQKKTLKSYVIFDNQTPVGYTHVYQTTNEDNQGCALAIYFDQSLSQDYEKEAVFLELFLENYVFDTYKFCIVDVDNTNQAFKQMFLKAGFSVHAELDGFSLLLKPSTQEI